MEYPFVLGAIRTRTRNYKDGVPSWPICFVAIGIRADNNINHYQKAGTVFERHFSVTECLADVCHAGTARLPRRRGTSAMPAWHVCRAGVADAIAASRHGFLPCRNGFRPCPDGMLREAFGLRDELLE